MLVNFLSITRLETFSTEASQGKFPHCSGYEARRVQHFSDFNLESFLLIKNILLTKNQTSLRKTVETGVELCPSVNLFVSNCPLAESPTTSQCQVECWNVIEEIERFYYEFLNRGGTRGVDWVACQPPTLRTAHPKS